MDNDDEKLIIKLISSIKYSDADKFLDHLISDVVKGKSRFIHMYDVIDDDNAQYYPFLSFWAGEKNKAVYMRLVAKLWEHSKYNLYYIPDGSTNIIDELIHTESFFYNNILHYNERSTYHFYSTRELLCSAINQDQFDFLKDGTKDTYLIRKNELLDVSIKDVPQYENAWNSEGKLTNKILQYDPKVTIESKYYESVVEERRKIIGDSAFTKSQKMDDSETVSKVEYHLYHPLSIVGINIDDELQISETTNIPAFLFAYINKYTDDKKFHALIGTLTDIGLEAFLFYFTGGASALGHLKHLKYLTNVGRSFKFSAEVSSKIRIFSGWHAGAEVLNLSTSVAFSVSNYIIATSNDSERVKLAKLVSKICFLGMLGSSGVSMYTNRKMVTAADEMFTELENLSNSNVLRYYNGMANEEKLLFDKFISHMVDISDSTSAGIQKFRTDLLNYLPENSTILSKLDITDSNAFSVSERLDFYFDFGRKLDRNGKSFQGEFWKKFNKGGQNTIDNWLNLRNANLIERLEIDVLSKTNLSNRIIQFASNTTYVDGVITLSSVYREINISRRINLMKNLSENRNTSEFNALMNLLAEKPKNLNFLDEALHAEKKAQYIRNYNEVLELILDNEFNRFQFNYLRHLNLKFVEEASKVFTKVCKIVNPTVQELRGLYDDTIDLLKNDLKVINNNTDLTEQELDILKDKILKGPNILFIPTLKVNGTEIGDYSGKLFLAGDEERLSELVKINDEYPACLIDPIIDSAMNEKYLVFSQTAFIKDGIKYEKRFFDTEVKLLFDFLENIYEFGESFEIVLNSKIFACESCQRFLVTLFDMANDDGKFVNVRFVGDSEIQSSKDFNKITN